MADSKRLTTLKALCAYLMAEVRVSNGYKHDLGGAFRGRMFFDTEDPFPCISILEANEPDRYPRRAGGNDGTHSPTQYEQWLLLIQGWTTEDKENPSDPALEFMADIKKALAKINKGPNPQTGLGGDPNFNLGGLVAGMTMEPGSVRPPQEQTSELGYFYLRIVLQFVEDTNDPYLLS